MNGLFNIIKVISVGVGALTFIAGLICVGVFFHWLLLEYLYPIILRHFKVYPSFVAWIKLRHKFDEFAGNYVPDVVNEHEAIVRLLIIRELRFTIGFVYSRPEQYQPDEIDGVLASLGDTLDGDTALTILRHYNETGEVWTPLVANSHPL